MPYEIEWRERLVGEMAIGKQGKIMGKRICVMLGANLGLKPIYSDLTQQLAARLVSHQCTLVYGGGRLGLMGVLADAVLALGGEVIGVSVPSLFEHEGHPYLNQLHLENSMFERKQKMLAISDAFIALPGGLGTLDEIMDFWNVFKMELSAKPVGLLNVEGYYDIFLSLVQHMIHHGFLAERHGADLLVSDDPGVLLKNLIEKSQDER